jgi:hypothetical protein
MIVFWGLLLGLPVLSFGVASLVRPAASRRFASWFGTSRACAVVLSAIAWFWTAHECDTIGIDVFDNLLTLFPGQVWAMAAILTVLVVRWMPKNLPVRALTGILMLIPAQLFRTTRLLLPESGCSLVHLFVVTGYYCAIVGMYGMFYPWRLEKGLALAQRTDARARLLGAVLTLWGASLAVAGWFV